MTGVRRVLAGLRWYLREIGGDARYDEHVRHCRREGHPVPTRRAFERTRSDARAAVPGARCC